MMEKILLSVTSVGTKMLCAEALKPLQCDRAFAGKITLPQDPFDPDVDRERPEPLIPKEQYAIGDFLSHPRQTTKLGSGLVTYMPGAAAR